MNKITERIWFKAVSILVINAFLMSNIAYSAPEFGNLRRMHTSAEVRDAFVVIDIKRDPEMLFSAADALQRAGKGRQLLEKISSRLEKLKKSDDIEYQRTLIRISSYISELADDEQMQKMLLWFALFANDDSVRYEALTALESTLPLDTDFEDKKYKSLFPIFKRTVSGIFGKVRLYRVGEKIPLVRIGAKQDKLVEEITVDYKDSWMPMLVKAFGNNFEKVKLADAMQRLENAIKADPELSRYLGPVKGAGVVKEISLQRRPRGVIERTMGYFSPTALAGLTAYPILNSSGSSSLSNKLGEGVVAEALTRGFNAIPQPMGSRFAFKVTDKGTKSSDSSHSNSITVVVKKDESADEDDVPQPAGVRAFKDFMNSLYISLGIDTLDIELGKDILVAFTALEQIPEIKLSYQIDDFKYYYNLPGMTLIERIGPEGDMSYSVEFYDAHFGGSGEAKVIKFRVLTKFGELERKINNARRNGLAISKKKYNPQPLMDLYVELSSLYAWMGMFHESDAAFKKAYIEENKLDSDGWDKNYMKVRAYQLYYQGLKALRDGKDSKAVNLWKRALELKSNLSWTKELLKILSGSDVGLRRENLDIVESL